MVNQRVGSPLADNGRRSDIRCRESNMFPTTLRREIIMALALKAGLLVLLYLLFFSLAHRPTLAALQAHIMGGGDGHR
jgi:hypothetical protein